MLRLHGMKYNIQAYSSVLLFFFSELYMKSNIDPPVITSIY